MYDVVVCGAGPAGTAAAVTAARHGARVLLLERYGFAGGMATSALVNPIAGWEFVDPHSGVTGSLIGGFFREVAERLRSVGAFGSTWSPGAFDEQYLKYLYDRMLREAGVDVMFHTWIAGVVKHGQRVEALETYSKEGRRLVLGKIFIDSTGDGDVAALAGCDFSYGRPSDGLAQAMTTKFRMANVDKAEMLRHADTLHQARALVEPYFQEARSNGSFVFPHRDRVQFYDYPRPGVLHFNMTRINELSPLSVADLTEAEMEGRRQAYAIAEWLVKSVPYFQNAWLEKVACQVGVRETRHIAGEYTVTHQDIAEGRKFPDGIMRSTYFIDIHSPKGAGFEHEQSKWQIKDSFRPPAGDYYEVPYRSILPLDAENLLVACRALSCTHEGAAAVRVMANMIALGEAAGIAGARAALKCVSPHELDGRSIRNAIGYMDDPPDYGEIWSPLRIEAS